MSKCRLWECITDADFDECHRNAHAVAMRTRAARKLVGDAEMADVESAILQGDIVLLEQYKHMSPREFVDALESGVLQTYEFTGSSDEFLQFIADVRAGKYD